MPVSSADSIVAMYFEADRSDVRRRYEAVFARSLTPSEDASLDDADGGRELDFRDESNSEPGESADTSDLDVLFDAALLSPGIIDELVDLIRKRWQLFDDDTKLIALHYLLCLHNDAYTITHALEGMVVTFNVWGASPYLHALEPEIAFPVDGEVSYLRLREILDGLGITFDDSKDLTEFEVWFNLSTAVADWGIERNLEPWQWWAAVYDLGPRLLTPPPSFPVEQNPRVWVIATNNEFDEFAAIDEHGTEAVGTWAINRAARRGDLALMYCVKPRSAIVGVYRVLEDAHRDPFGGWSGYRADVGEKIGTPWIRLTDMKADPILSDWKLVRGNFQGLLKHEVPENVWDRLKEIVGQNDAATGERLNALGLAAHGVRELRVSGEKWSEKQVEDQLIIPLLKELGWELGRTVVQQVEMMIKVGSGRPQKVRADFVGYSGDLTCEPLMVLEAKRRISSTRELEDAAQQAESYAGRLRCPTYAVAAPEGIWVYELQFPRESRLLGNFGLEGEPVEGLSRKLDAILGFTSLAEVRGQSRE